MQLDDLCKFKPFVIGLMELWNDLATQRNIEHYIKNRQSTIHKWTIPSLPHDLIFSSLKF